VEFSFCQNQYLCDYHVKLNRKTDNESAKQLRNSFETPLFHGFNSSTMPLGIFSQKNIKDGGLTIGVVPPAAF